METSLFDASSPEPCDGTLDPERREFERIAPQDSRATAILCDPLTKSEHTVQVVDQSSGGLRVLLEDEHHLSIGSTVGVDFDGTLRPASVRWVLAKRKRGWRLGLQWLN
jgi:hypothetical protein